YSDWARSGRDALDDHIGPVGDNLPKYLNSLTPDQRKRQAELLIKQPISTVFADSYAGQIPSRLQVMRAAGKAHNIDGSLIAAIILAEQRDQSRAEDGRDYVLGFVFEEKTSIGVRQIVPTTAHD